MVYHDLRLGLDLVHVFCSFCLLYLIGLKEIDNWSHIFFVVVVVEVFIFVVGVSFFCISVIMVVTWKGVTSRVIAREVVVLRGVVIYYII